MSVAPAQSDDDVILLSPEEEDAFFEAQCRTLLGISGHEFRERLVASEFDDVIDDGDHGDLLYVAALSRVAR